MFVYRFSRHWAELIWPFSGGYIKTRCYVTIGNFWRKKNWNFRTLRGIFFVQSSENLCQGCQNCILRVPRNSSGAFFWMTCVFIVFFRVEKEIFEPLSKMGRRGCLNCILKSMGTFRGKPTFLKKLFSWSFSDLTGVFLGLCWIFLAWLKLLTTSP